MSTTTATGRNEQRHGMPYLVMTRQFRAPIDDVWAAVTESDRLARWIGTWSGDPAEGEVTFQMRYEGDDVPSERFVIDECEAPHRLAITTEAPYEAEQVTWHLELDLAEADGVTTLTFAQSVPDPAMAESVGPGWDYYFDRMVVAETGGDVTAVVFDDYYPALSEHYKAEFGS
ncbi:SRPBCC family protein [Nocardioides bizhenqiangii]|uniref:SRPBCC family protein n=1 Tax=Nocardioides bizhenqiangii TaxID=3095076 RepID=A0ABZ0ZNC9_9ACTN|nr:SRPBCC family protein [Nocardioides sp. HM61]WQQ25813.1 SRPBCC family protein [Nocardioides sp. HM61]